MLNRKEYMREYYLKNKEKHKKYYEKYYIENVKKIKEQTKKHAKLNKDKIKEYRKRWERENRELRNEMNKKYRKNNVKKIKEQKKQYRQTPNGKIRQKVYMHNRRLLTRGLTVQIIQQVYEDNIKRFGTLTCCLCNKSIEFGQDSLEHKIPISKGGSNDIDNLEIAHFSCNSSKGNKILEEYRLGKL